MAYRHRALGWESGTIVDGTITGGNITVDALAKRTGNYGLLIDGQSGVNSRIVYTWGAPSIWNQEFHRFYLKIDALPSADRIIAGFATNSNGSLTTTSLALTLKTTGKLEFRMNGVLQGTSASSLVAGTFYCIEVGMELSAPSACLRIDSNVEIDWTTIATMSQGTFLAFGVNDTVASALKIYIDDWASDINVWCGKGRVKRIGVTAIRNDNATWSNVGAAASKWQAVNEVTPDDDTSYVLSSTTTNAIYFSVDPAPADATKVRGISWYVRAKRDGASNGSMAFRPRAGDFIVSATASTFAPAAAYAYFHASAIVSYSPKGPRFGLDTLADYAIGLHTASANPSRVSAVWGEMDYTDDSSAQESHIPVYICGFEVSPSIEYASRTNSSNSGTLTSDTGHPKFGSRALKIVHAAAGRSYADFGDLSSFAGLDTELWICGWFYCESLPSSGSMDIAGLGTTSTGRTVALFVGSDGSLNTVVNAVTGTALAAGTIVTGQYYHFALRIQGRSASLATDGAVEVWINDIRVINRTALDTGITGMSASIAFIGSHQNVAGGATVHYDGIILDLGSRFGRNTKVATLIATAAGALTDAGFVATGTTDKWDCIDDQPVDDDTTYVLSPLSTTAVETYVTTDLAAASKSVYGVQINAWFKRDGATNGIMQFGYRPTNQASILSSNVASTSAYLAYSDIYRTTTGRGMWTPSLVSVIELAQKALSPANKTRVSSLFATVAYTEISDRGANRAAQAQIVG
jgi:hypothetical protein